MAEKVRVQLVLDKELVDAVDALMAEIDGNRTGFIAGAIENCLEDVSFLRRLGLTPRRLKKMVLVLRRFGYFENPDSLESIVTSPEVGVENPLWHTTP